MTQQNPVLLTVRGTVIPDNLAAARELHNQTAGSPQGIAASRAMSDMSHVVYAPCLRSEQSDARDGELLFLDVWADANGLMQFFSNPVVQSQADKLFSSRDGSVWMPAQGALTVHMPPQRGRPERYLALVRGPVSSPEAAVAAFREANTQGLRKARQRGLISHELFFKMGPPDQAPELLGVDLWFDFQGMTEHYGDSAIMAPLGSAFAGRPSASVWEPAAGPWSEW